MKKHNWVNLWEAPLSLLWGESTTGIFAKDNQFKHLPGCRCNYVLYFSENNAMKAHHLKEEIELSATWGKEAHDTSGYIQNYVKEATNLNEDSKHFAKEVSDADLSSLESTELARLYERYFYFHQASVAYYKLCNDEFQEAIAKELREYIEPKLDNKSELPDIISELTFPDTLNTLDKQELGLLHIAQTLIKRKGSLDNHSPEINALIKEHLEDFGWIGTGEGGGFWTDEYVQHDLERLVTLSEEEIANKVEEKENKQSTISARRQELADKYELTPTLRQYLEQIIALAETKLEIRIGWAYRDYYVLSLIDEVAKRLSINKDQVSLLLSTEVVDMLAGKLELEPKTFADRQRAYLFMILEGQQSFFDGDEAIKKFHEEVDEKDFSEEVEVKGSIARTGYVKGIAKLISPLENQNEGIARVQEGDILITGMTRPHMLPAMKKAAAYVTDEGGITCHAAIVARELGKPCVIATKIATKIFKDGDLIEVDANTGIVRKLEGV